MTRSAVDEENGGQEGILSDSSSRSDRKEATQLEREVIESFFQTSVDPEYYDDISTLVSLSDEAPIFSSNRSRRDHPVVTSTEDDSTVVTPPSNSLRSPMDTKDDSFHRRLYDKSTSNNPLDTASTHPSYSRVRLVPRNRPHFQSLNKVAVTKSAKPRLIRSMTMPIGVNTFMHRYLYQFFPKSWLSTYWSLIGRDWYHTLLRWPTYLSLLFWSCIWTVSILLFALIYMAADRSYPNVECGLSVGFTFHFQAAFAFSLETCTTVGYTLPGGTNSFFEQCPGVQIAIFTQLIFSLIFNALLMSFLYTRISRSETRGSQLLFSNKAIVRPITYTEDAFNDRTITRWTLEVRVFDVAAAHPLVEAHVRLYASFMGENRNLMQVCRLLRPDDSLNGYLFTSIPYSIVHEIDAFSPLAPSSTVTQWKEDHKRWFLGWEGLERRSVDARIENSSTWVCPVCSLGCGQLVRLVSHIKYMRLQDQASNIPMEQSHLRIPEDVLHLSTPYVNSMNEHTLRKHLANVEIICVVEAIDPITSGTFQALQSYTMDDIVFGGSFKPCIRQVENEFQVDMDSFHRIIPQVNQNSDYHSKHLKET